MNSIKVALEKVTFMYPSSPRLILDAVSFAAVDGSYLSVLGENGSGKTTLMKLVLGLHKPVKGRVICHAKRIGYVPQQKAAFDQLPVTVGEFLSAARNALHVKDCTADKEALCKVGLEEKEEALLGTLSGGELQRVFIAQALLGHPDLLILDEPSTGVDIENQARLYTLIRELNRKNGITIIAVEHNLQAAIQNSTEIFHLEKGVGHLCSPKRYAEEYLGGMRFTGLTEKM